MLKNVFLSFLLFNKKNSFELHTDFSVTTVFFRSIWFLFKSHKLKCVEDTSNFVYLNYKIENMQMTKEKRGKYPYILEHGEKGVFNYACCQTIKPFDTFAK